MILTCATCHDEWVSEEEDDEDPCPYCAKASMEAAREEYDDMKREDRREREADPRNFEYWEKRM